MLLSVLICFYGKKISVSEFLRSARSSFLLFPIKKENRQRLYNLLSIFILKLIKILILHIIVFIFPVIMRQNPGSRSIPPGSTARTFRRRSFSPLLCRLILLYALTHHGLFTIFNPYLYLLLLIFQTLSNAVSRIHVPGQYCSHTYSRPYPLNRTPAYIQHPEVLLGHPGT